MEVLRPLTTCIIYTQVWLDHPVIFLLSDRHFDCYLLWVRESGCPTQTQSAPIGIALYAFIVGLISPDLYKTIVPEYFQSLLYDPYRNWILIVCLQSGAQLSSERCKWSLPIYFNHVFNLPNQSGTVTIFLHGAV